MVRILIIALRCRSQRPDQGTIAHTIGAANALGTPTTSW